jgi:N-acetylglutamate synthase-like GNAT family acetyltransferase
MVTDIVIRKATIADSLELARMRWDFQQEFGKQPACSQQEFIKECNKFFMQHLNEQNFVCWVAEHNNQIIAHACLHLIQKIPKPRELLSYVGYLTNCYTIETYRNKGIGNKLLHHLIDDARAQGTELLIVWPSEKSFSFYERAGFIKPENCRIMQLNEAL